MRAVLASEMLQRLREVTDASGDTHLSDAELYRALTSAVADTWDVLLMNGLGTEGVKMAEFTTTAGTLEYDLGSDSVFSIEGASASTVPDFFRVQKVMVKEGTNQWRPISRIERAETHAYRPVDSACTVRLYYFPCAPTFTTGAESFDGINGWEEHTIQTAAMHIKAKKFDDTAPYRARKRELEARMETMASRNADEPPRVIRRARAAKFAQRYAPYNANLTAWDIRGDKLQMYYAFGSYLT